jgi:hypothetical protein
MIDDLEDIKDSISDLWWSEHRDLEGVLSVVGDIVKYLEKKEKANQERM